MRLWFLFTTLSAFGEGDASVIATFSVCSISSDSHNPVNGGGGMVFGKVPQSTWAAIKNNTFDWVVNRQQTFILTVLAAGKSRVKAAVCLVTGGSLPVKDGCISTAAPVEEGQQEGQQEGRQEPRGGSCPPAVLGPA